MSPINDAIHPRPKGLGILACFGEAPCAPVETGSPLRFDEARGIPLKASDSRLELHGMKRLKPKERTEVMELPLDYEDITKILPHRYPFLLVDRVTELEPMKRVVGIKNVSINEPFFQGHFPGNPIMPGVLIVEAMAQAGGVLARLSVPGALEREETIYFMAIDKVRFRKPVVPGDQLILELRPLRTGSRVWKMAGKAFVKDDLVAEAELMATIG